MFGLSWLKIGIYAGAVIAVLLALRLWGNQQYKSGAEYGRVAATREVAKAKEAEWRLQEDFLSNEKLRLAEEWKSVEVNKAANRAEKAEIQRMKAESKAVLDKISAAAAERLGDELENLRSTPDSELDDALRDISRRITAWKAANP